MIQMRRHGLENGLRILILFSPLFGSAQVSIIQDGKGETSLETLKNTISLNFGQEEISGNVFKVLKDFEDKGELVGGLGFRCQL